MAFGDVVHLSAIQISHPDAALAYDLDKDQAIQSRKRILDMAASERFAMPAPTSMRRVLLRGAQGRDLRLRAGGN